MLPCLSCVILGKFGNLSVLPVPGCLPKITEIRSGSTEKLCNLPRVTELRYGNTERLSYCPKIIQLKGRSTGSSGNFPKIELLRRQSNSGLRQLANVTQVRYGGTEKF